MKKNFNFKNFKQQKVIDKMREEVPVLESSSLSEWDVRHVIELFQESSEYFNKKIEDERDTDGKSQFAIDLFNDIIDAKELAIQYTLHKLNIKSDSTFEVGDWVVRKDGEIFSSGNYAEQITSIEVDKRGKCIWLSSKTWIRDDYIRLWKIADAKNGDILHHWCTASNGTFIFKGINESGKIFCYCDYDSEDHFCLGKYHNIPHSLDSKFLHPATKEQVTLLFAKMKEAGYQWDEDNKELKKISKHYDINNFHAGMPVLVRETSLNAWQYVLFSHCYVSGDGLIRFNAGLVGFTQCIPFNNDTKCLLGTTNVPSEEYINW